ncbi:hypothetical protein DPEC_G00247070 [Dallia pectoralis]|uniref:Uncharacterized protein n=1 Tax=Dallia pectoralis TaxID=75939 RepID=A0ACC2FW67_DALPE|nr:hypothetical protein DPEC_G00247070 [Dallia pectoralis]
MLDLCSSSHLHHKMTFQEATRCTTKRWGIHLMQRTDPKSLYRNLLSVMHSMLLLNVPELAMQQTPRQQTFRSPPLEVNASIS